MNHRVLAFFFAALVLLASPALGAERVCVIHVDGTIGPTTASYIARGVNDAAEQGAQCLVIQLDTPGGLLESTKSIVTTLLSSPVPTVVYVSPSGASAASAGCFITLAADVAVMAPATTIGAAHPVEIGSPTSSSQPDDVMRHKLENFATSYIATIAARRHRNVEWAESAVRESASITADKALELHVIDLVATDMGELLSNLDGRQVNGHTLHTAGAKVEEIPMTARERVFQALWRPEVMFILMLVAMYGIIGELSSPGAILPGVAGAIALILLLYMSAVLPINVAGLALIGLAIVLFIADVFTPTHGVLTAGGVAAFFVGSLMLFDRHEPYFRLSLAFIIPATLVTAGFFVFVVSSGLRAQFLPVKVGINTLVGRTVPALTAIDRTAGKVFIDGEYWNALSDTPIERGRPVRIASVEGLTLKVRPE